MNGLITALGWLTFTGVCVAAAIVLADEGRKWHRRHFPQRVDEQRSLLRARQVTGTITDLDSYRHGHAS